jgi:hypothetical protein
MNNQKGIALLQFVLAIVVLAGIIGYCMNVYKFVVQCDFESPYKCEMIRGIGLGVPPAGAIIGYLTID